MERRPFALFVRRHRSKIALSVVVAAGFVWVLDAGSLKLVPNREELARVEWWTLAAYLAIWSAVHCVRAVRWAWLLAPLHPVPLKKLLAVSFIGFAAIVMLPFRTGEAVRPVLVRQKGLLSGWAAAGTVAAERIIDGLVLSLVLFAGLQIAPPLDELPHRVGDLALPVSLVPKAAYGALALFAVAFAAMAGFYFWQSAARRLTERVVGIVSRRLAAWVSERLASVASGLGFLPQLRYSGPFVAATTVYWLANAAATWVLARGCGFERMPYAVACVSMGILALGILAPNAPGFFGQYQVALYAGFLLYYPEAVVRTSGAAYVFLAYVSQLSITLGAAAIGMVMERTSLSEVLGTANAPPEGAPPRD